ncbi:hypothetical protein H5410_051633 [Solanum commersonii]|uniref:DUF4283 domain-containing protein n=1 Tax=Solanum commersonii TaxID=4109 RepID=A0A9J5X1B0_SOLCO|nr:hypothetical protein H5410_051633 [Solanum commersonii]
MERSEHGNRSDTNTNYLFQLLCFMKLHTYTRVQVSIDICGVDYPSRKQRFEVVYNLLSIRYNSRIRIQTSAVEKAQQRGMVSASPTIASLERYIANQWNYIVKPTVYYHNDVYFLVRFPSLEDRAAVMYSRPHLLNNKTRGREYTRTNGHTYSIIDWGWVNATWIMTMAQHEIQIMEPRCSDHSPLCLLIAQEEDRRARPFKFSKPCSWS